MDIDPEPDDDLLEPVDPLEPLDPREAARDRRRDRDAGAMHRALMRPGMGKVFKQIDEAIGKRADEPPERRQRRKPRPR